MYISTVIFIIIYLSDVAVGYLIFGTTGALIVALGLPLGIAVQIRITVFKADAVPLEHLSPRDRERVALVFESVLHNAENNGVTFSRNPKIYLSEDRSMNAFNAGNAIIINRGLLSCGCLEGICAHEIKHWRFNDSYCSCLICSSITVFIILAAFVLSIYVLAAVLIVGILASIIGNSTTGFIAGSLTAKLLGKIKDLILKADLFIMKGLQAVLSRYTEYKADEFAVRLGYGEQLKHFLRLTFESRQAEKLSARLLSTHPSDSRRIGRIQRIMNEMCEDETKSLPFRV